MFGDSEPNDADTPIPYDDCHWHNYVDKLIADLKSDTTDNVDDNKNNIKICKIIITKCMPTCPCALIEEKIFSPICPLLKDIIFDMLNRVDEKTRGQYETKVELFELTECKTVLSLCEDLIRHIEKYKNSFKHAELIQSCLKYLPMIVIKVCQEYNKKFSAISSPLSSSSSALIIFKDVYIAACLLASLYCNVTSTVVKFVNNEKDVELLKCTIKHVGVMASLTIYGSSTICLLAWNTFFTLICETELSKFISEMSNFMMGYFKNIGNDIIWFINNLPEIKSIETYTRRVKFINVLLDMLVRLHQYFLEKVVQVDINKYNTQLVEEMADIIIQLTGHYILNPKEISESTEEEEEEEAAENKAKCKNIVFKRNWPVLLMNFYNVEIFEKVLTDKYPMAKCKCDLAFTIGFHYSILNSKLKIEQKFQMAITHMNQVQQLQLQKARQGIKNSIYEDTLICLCNDLLGDDLTSFTKVEMILVEYLLCEEFWPSLLCFDIFRFCYRAASKQLVLTHFNFFTMSLEKLVSRSSFVVFLLSKLIIEIVNVLLPEELINSCCYCSSLSKDGLSLLVKSQRLENVRRDVMMDFYKKCVSIDINECLPIHLSQVINELREKPNLQNWSRLMNLLTTINANAACTDDLMDLVRLIMNTWRWGRINNDYSKYWMIYEMFVALIGCIQINEQSSEPMILNWTFLMMISKGIIEENNLSSNVALKMCHYLRTIVKMLSNDDGISSDEGNSKVLLVDLICYVLENDDVLIYQEALEVLNFTVDNCKNNKLIMKIGSAIKKNVNLVTTVSAYLRRKNSRKLLCHSDIDDYLKVLTKHCTAISLDHTCCKIIQTFTEDEERHIKMPKLMENDNVVVEERAKRCSYELMALIKERHHLSAETIEMLSNSCTLFIKK